MKISVVSSDGGEYSCNVYLVTGSSNAIGDVNTLVDVGRDPGIIEKILLASTGVGKKRVEQVVLTHSHFDHASLLPEIRSRFSPKVCAASPFLEGVDVILKGGEQIRMGDRDFEVIATPGHSSDSLCFFCPKDGILFAGDSPLTIMTGEGTYEPGFVHALETLCTKDIKSIYFGHGKPLLEGVDRILKESLRNVRKSVR